MPDLITQAQPSLQFLEPHFNPWVLRGVRSLLPLWMRWQVQLPEIQISNAEQLLDLYQQFHAKKIRLMLAFRHPSTNDPFSMAHLLWRHLPALAKQQGVPLQHPIHAHFIYDRGIPLWAGEWLGWLYSRLGCTPIRRGRVDIPGLRSIRHLFTDGQFPMAAAPEGATNGHNEIVSPIEPGIAQFGFWCMEDLQKAGRSEQVVILPIGIQYHYLQEPWPALEALLHQLERDSGLTAPDAPTQNASEFPIWPEGQSVSPQIAGLYQRLYRLAEHLLDQMETFYTRFYHQALPQASATTVDGDPSDRALHQRLANRLQTLLDSALQVAEQFFDLPTKGTVTDRCRRIEQAAWDRIYRDDLKQFEMLSPVEQGLANRIAEESSLRIWHMRLVESFVSVTGRYVFEKPTAERFAETLLLLWEMVVRIQGKATFPRPQLGQQRVNITVGEAIALSDWRDAYQTNRRKTVADLTQTLQQRLESMIV